MPGTVAAAPAAGRLKGCPELTVEGDMREMAKTTTWSVSSCKPGNGVASLRDDSLDTYWQRQHIMEYWMMASLQQQGGAAAAEAVRVRDPAAAEAFFVPFFSSLSFNVHGRNMTDPDTEADRLLQVELMDILGKSEYWQRSAGRDHVIPMHHPNAFRFMRDMVNASVLIVSDFGRYTKELASLRKDVVAPYVHVVDSFLDDNASDPFEADPTLLFFWGRRENPWKTRKDIKDRDGVRFEDSLATGDGIKISTDGMRSSKFCLHPAGDTPSSCRLFDAIVSHCIPVIISSRIELPFEDEIDYSEFSPFFSVEEALEPDYLLNQLRQMPKEKWVEMWSKLKNVSSHYEFQYPPRKDDAVNMIWRHVRHKIPAVNLAIHMSRRLEVPDWWHDVLNVSQGLLQELGIYLLSFDRPGYCESDAHPAWTKESIAVDIAELADNLQLGARFHLMGFSMGGEIMWSSLKHIPHTQ
ncbi:hypothetical protein ZWY2020_059306 [Hordeum vulgare]|nr:hypothetical protein ZWY2020_059306 [Hordeum vulgare]